MRLLLFLLCLLAASVAEAETVWGLEQPCAGGVAVEAGDKNYGPIAERVFGDKTRWREIAIANPEVDPTKLKVGQCLLTHPAPSAEVLLRIVLAFLVRKDAGLPAIDAATGGAVVPLFDPLFQRVLAVCAVMASAGLSPEDANGVEDVCTMRLIDAWRFAATPSSTAIATPAASSQ